MKVQEFAERKCAIVRKHLRSALGCIEGAQLDPPIPCVGRQGLFDVDEATLGEAL